MTVASTIDSTQRTRDVLAQRMAVVKRMLAGEASYEDVLAFHHDDFVWLSAGGVRLGRAEALEHNTARMAHLSGQALSGFRIIRQAACGEYGFTMFKTDLVPFGTDTYRVVDGKVAFQSNAIYLAPAARGAHA